MVCDVWLIDIIFRTKIKRSYLRQLLEYGDSESAPFQCPEKIEFGERCDEESNSLEEAITHWFVTHKKLRLFHKPSRKPSALITGSRNIKKRAISIATNNVAKIRRQKRMNLAPREYVKTKCVPCDLNFDTIGKAMRHCMRGHFKWDKKSSFFFNLKDRIFRWKLLRKIRFTVQLLLYYKSHFNQECYIYSIII